MYGIKKHLFSFGLILWAITPASAADPQSAQPPPKDAVPVPSLVVRFDKEKLMGVPQGFMVISQPENPKVRWEIQRDAQAPSKPNVLVQMGKAEPGDNYGMIVVKDKQFTQGEISVRFKILSGEEEQTAGIIFRYQDDQNYDVIRASGKDDNVVFYHVKKGKRKALDTKNAIVTPYLWHELKVIFTDKTYTALLDNETVLGGKYYGIPDTGLIGLWTRSDAQTAFDNFQFPR